MLIIYSNTERIGMSVKRLDVLLCRENKETIRDHLFSTYANFS